MADAFTTLVAIQPRMSGLASEVLDENRPDQAFGTKSSLYGAMRARDTTDAAAPPPGTVLLAPLPSPTGLVAVPVADTVQLSWNPVTGAASYVVLWTSQIGLPFSSWSTGASAVPSITTGHLNTGLYFFTVLAVNADGVPGQLAEVVQVSSSFVPLPFAPILPVLKTFILRVQLWWNVVIGAQSYAIYYSSLVGQGKNGTRIPAGSPPFDFPTLSGPFYVTVVAVGASGEGPLSPEVMAFVSGGPMNISPSSPIVAPRGTQAFTVSGGYQPFTWSILTNNSGGSIVPSTGVYTAGSTPNVSDVIQVTDTVGDSPVTVSISVTAGVSVITQDATANPLPIVPQNGLVSAFDATFSPFGTSWVDQVGGVYKVNGLTGANLSTYGGVPVFRADGYTNYPFVGLPTAGPFTIMVVDRYNGLGVNHRGRNLSATGNNWLLARWNGNYPLFHSNGLWVGPSSSPASDNNWHLTIGVGSGAADASYKLYADGIDVTAGNGSGNAGPIALSLGGGSEFSNADTAVVLTWNRILTPAECASVRAAYGYRFGLTATVPTVTVIATTSVPGGAKTLTATGGSGTGYAWAFVTNNSIGSLDAAGHYVAGIFDGVDTVRVTDSLGNTTTITVTVAGVPPVVAPQTVAPRATATLSATGGTAPYTWALTVNNSGSSVTGNVYTAGSTPGAVDTVRVTDATNRTTTVALTVGVGVTIIPTTPAVSASSSQQFTATGGSGTGFVFTLPTNLSGGNITTGGLYTSGTTTGVSDVVRATDSLGNTTTVSVIVSATTSLIPSDARAESHLRIADDGTLVDLMGPSWIKNGPITLITKTALPGFRGPPVAGLGPFPATANSIQAVSIPLLTLAGDFIFTFVIRGAGYGPSPSPAMQGIPVVMGHGEYQQSYYFQFDNPAGLGGKMGCRFDGGVLYPVGATTLNDATPHVFTFARAGNVFFWKVDKTPVTLPPYSSPPYGITYSKPFTIGHYLGPGNGYNFDSSNAAFYELRVLHITVTAADLDALHAAILT